MKRALAREAGTPLDPGQLERLMVAKWCNWKDVESTQNSTAIFNSQEVVHGNRMAQFI